MLKEIVQSVIGRFGYRIMRKQVGDDYIQALTLLVSDTTQPVIFDVGAHRGETARTFTHNFPDADLYCFEPFADSFKVLNEHKSAYPRANLVNAGLSDSSGVQQFNVNVGSPTNSLLPLDRRASKTWGQVGLTPSKQVACQFYTLDDFLMQRDIDRIDLLKIDVQGAEYLVLQGGASSLAAGHVRAVYLEIILGPTYVGQWKMSDYLGYLERMGFRLVGLYNFMYGAQRELIQLDALFVHSQ